MSPRRARRREDLPRPLRTDGESVTESGPDGDWIVRPVSGAAAVKVYRCPGCDQEIAPGLPHVVAWQVDDADNRRHWHRPCFDARGRRGVKTHRSKNAPRHG
jgi:hypothetical protein